jgi:hypothetical protein
MVVALAPNLKEARKLLSKKMGQDHDDMKIRPLTKTTPCAFYVCGGG